jgi:2-polyprenyl-3-methyl-5-hydroxy-6-metoxy-1,4-benzoquinol methylase
MCCKKEITNMKMAEESKEAWEKVYLMTSNPFDVEEPYQWIVDLETKGKIMGTVLDAGCGAGHNSIYLARQGYTVVGMDISSNAIERAKHKASEKGVAVEFIQANIVEFAGYDNRFETVIDIGCFHSLDEEDYTNYSNSLHRACRPGAMVYLRAFSDTNTQRGGYTGPAVSESQIRNAFSQGWRVQNLEQQEVEVVLFEAEKQKAYVWFAEICYM